MKSQHPSPVAHRPFACVLALAWASAAAGDNNLHRIDHDPATGFAVYRMGKPTANDVAALCALGVEEVAVLSGNAASHERRNAALCPALRVVYDRHQTVDEPLDTAFLRRFDAWVAEAMRRGKKIAFRCNCGCHRTGRLAAYYQMRYQGVSVGEAHAILLQHGKRMWLPRYRGLKDQVQALHDHIEGRACSVAPQHCVREVLPGTDHAGWVED